MDVAALIEQHQDRLTPAERRVATVVLDQPQLVAFGTVAELARQASTSGASVIRLSTKLGFDGFSSLQDTVQRDLGRQLRPATARIRQPEAGDLLDRALHVELDNTQATLDNVDRERFGLAIQRAGQLGHPRLRAGRRGLERHRRAARRRTCRCCVPASCSSTGSAVRVHRTLAELRPGDTVLTLDLPRYDAWLIGAAEAAASRHATVIALSDSVLSPLARVRRPALRRAGQGHRAVRQLPRRAGPARRAGGRRGRSRSGPRPPSRSTASRRRGQRRACSSTSDTTPAAKRSTSSAVVSKLVIQRTSVVDSSHT